MKSKSKIAATTAVSFLGSVSLVAAFVPAAHASGDLHSVDGASGIIAPAAKFGAGSISARAGIGAHTTDAAAAVGTFTLIDSTESDSDNDFTVTHNGTDVGVFDGWSAGEQSEPQLLPAGTYNITDSAGDTGDFTVTAGGDLEVVLIPVEGGSAFQAYPDNVASANHASVLSFRNATSSDVDLYLNGNLTESDVGSGQDDLTIPTGTDTLAIVLAGTGAPKAANTVISSVGNVPDDSYLSTYLATDGTRQGVSLVTVTHTQGYQYTASDGGVFDYGGYGFDGSLGGLTLNAPIVGGGEAQDGTGYYLVASDGGVFAFGGAAFLGSLGNLHLNSPIVGMVTTSGPDGPGYYLVAADGGVFAFGGAHFYGSLGAASLTSPVVGIAADPLDGHYTLAQADGHITSFSPGDPTGTPVALSGQLNAPIVGIATTPDGEGAWVVAADGGVFTVGDAPYLGSTGGTTLNKPVVSISSTYDGLGYALIAADGGVFNYGNSVFYGSTGGTMLNQPIVGVILGADAG